jgi:invasion protein IalB
MRKMTKGALALALIGLPIGAATWAGASTPASTPAPVEAGAPGPRLTAQRFGAWTYRCQEPMVDGKPGRPACELVQDVVVERDGTARSVMSVAIAAAADAKTHAITIQVPLGVRLKPGLGLAVDDGAAQAMGFDYCGPRGCWVAGAPIDGQLASLKAGKAGRVRLVLLDDRPLAIEFPLAGIADGLAALDAGPAAPEPKGKPKTKS